jgi:hypothetical protein
MPSVNKHFGRVSFFVVLALVVSCASARQKALSTALASLNGARDGFTTWDSRYQQEIVASATSIEDGRTKLTTYREKREPILRGFVVAYSLLAAAALGDSGLLEVQKAAIGLAAAIQALQRSL